MRKVFLASVLFLSVLFVSCSVDKNSPEYVAEQFLTAMQQENYDKAKEFCDQKTGQLVDMLKGLAKEVKKDNQKTKETKVVKILKTEKDEQGDKAKVFYTIGEEGKEQSLDVTKIEGKWKVAMDKEKGKEQNGKPHTHQDDQEHSHDH